MASLQITIQPFDIPTNAYVRIPGEGGEVPIPLEDLDEATLAELVDEFATAVMAKAAKQ